MRRNPKKTATAIVAVLASLAFAASASAQCAFNMGQKAKAIKSSLVRAYAGCPSITFPAPNTSTETGTPACAPPSALSTFKIDDKGKCDVKAVAKVEEPCKDNSGDNCVNVTIKAKCKGLLQPDGVTPVIGAGWTFQTVARATFADPINGDMTVIDFPVSTPFPDANKGKLKVKIDTNSILAGLFGPGTNLPECAQLEVLNLAIADPSGNVFAKQGVGGKP